MLGADVIVNVPGAASIGGASTPASEPESAGSASLPASPPVPPSPGLFATFPQPNNTTTIAAKLRMRPVYRIKCRDLGELAYFDETLSGFFGSAGFAVLVSVGFFGSAGFALSASLALSLSAVFAGALSLSAVFTSLGASSCPGHASTGVATNASETNAAASFFIRAAYRTVALLRR